MALHDEIFERYRAMNKIHGVMLELTHRCPCDCIHCFLVRNSRDELSLDEIRRLFRQLREEGTINIGITGGEPFLRTDLPGILDSARENGFFVSMLTTGMLIGPPEVELLEKFHVYNLEISLLGANPETHDAVIKCRGAFNNMMSAIRLLKNKHFNIMMKATLLKDNYRELDAMAALCKDLGIPFQANIFVSPRVDGSRDPQMQMLSSEEIRGLNQRLISGGLVPDENMGRGALLTCNAGKNSAGISPSGDVFPCIIMRQNVGSIRERTLRDIWHDHPSPFLETLRSMKPEDVDRCFACETRSRCRRCPGVAFLETGSPATASPGSCYLTEGPLSSEYMAGNKKA